MKMMLLLLVLILSSKIEMKFTTTTI